MATIDKLGAIKCQGTEGAFHAVLKFNNNNLFLKHNVSDSREDQLSRFKFSRKLHSAIKLLLTGDKASRPRRHEYAKNTACKPKNLATLE